MRNPRDPRQRFPIYSIFILCLNHPAQPLRDHDKMWGNSYYLKLYTYYTHWVNCQFPSLNNHVVTPSRVFTKGPQRVFIIIFYVGIFHTEYITTSPGHFLRPFIEGLVKILTVSLIRNFKYLFISTELITSHVNE